MFKIRKILSGTKKLIESAIPLAMTLIKSAIPLAMTLTFLYLLIGIIVYSADTSTYAFTGLAYWVYSLVSPIVLQVPAIGQFLIWLFEEDAPIVGFIMFLIFIFILIISTYDMVYRFIASAYDMVYRSPLTRHAQKALEDTIIPASERFQDGEEMMRKKDYAGAIEEFKAVLKKKPGYPGVYYNLGYCYMSMARYSEAVKSYREALKAQPGHFGAQLNIGYSYLMLGDLSNAEKELAEAMRLRPENGLPRFYLGQVYSLAGKYDDATLQYQKAKELEPGLMIEIAMGDNYLKAGKIDQAIEALRIAVMRSPNDDRAHYLLGLALSKKGRYEEAIAQYNEAISINPSAKTYADMLEVAKEAMKGAAGGTKKVIHEKEIIKEIVKVPCRYCGTLIENTSERCPSCGAPLK